MSHRPLTLLTTIMAVLAAVVIAPPAQAASLVSPGAVRLVTEERGCTEIAYARAGLLSVIRPLVPDRFTLVPFPPPGSPTPPPGSPDRVSLFINEVICRVAATDRTRGQARQREVATVIVSADTATVDGKPSDGVYVLLYATENRAQRAALNALGWPAARLSGASRGERSTTPGGLTQATISVRGSGWDHDLTAATVTALGKRQPSTAVYYRDTAEAQLKLCFANRVNVVDALYTGDLSRTPLATVTAVPPVFLAYPGFLVTGRWRSTLTSGSCPDR